MSKWALEFIYTKKSNKKKIKKSFFKIENLFIMTLISQFIQTLNIQMIK